MRHNPVSDNSSVSIDNRSEAEIIRFCLRHAIDNGLAAAVWRLPGQSVKYVVLARQYRRLESNTTIEDLPTGFMFAPFDPGVQSYFLPADYILEFENGLLKSPQTPAGISTASWLQEQADMGFFAQRSGIISGFGNAEESSDYLGLVRRSIEEIEKGRFEKIVPSRNRVVDLPEAFDCVNVFQKLCDVYNNALISQVFLPGVGHWLGATPEALVSVEEQRIFRTVALAGTMPYREGMNLKTIAWTQKEIEEQALVERYVISCFKKIRLREYDEHGPRTMVAGNLAHLKSDFTVDMQATNFPQLGSVMLRLLHPTSAVCGMPMENALEFLRKSEGYDREFYAGYLGPVNVGGNIDLFVNLRCMKVLEGKAVLYAGAGVTIDSDAEKEYEETELKFNTLLNVIS